MDPNQQQAILRGIAISSLHLSSFTPSDRQQAFTILEEFKNYDGRIALCISWLHAERHMFQEHDITIATQLMALEVCSSFLQQTKKKGNISYSALSESDRVAFRQAILKAARLATTSTDPGARILARKLATILEVLVIRDFPQRWTTFANDVFSPYQQGGLWYDEPGVNSGRHLGVKICLECLKLVAEDCTDSDFNAKIPTSRRNDVLIGLNEVSNQFLPRLFQILEHYPLLQQSKTNLHNMHTYLLSENRNVYSMTPEEASAYKKEKDQTEELAQLIADTLVTLERFCFSMPISWMIGGNQDFVLPMLYFLREPDADIQVQAVGCLEHLIVRGKLEFSQWMGLLSQLPPAIHEANQFFSSVEDQRKAAAAVKGEAAPGDSLALQLNFHRALSRLLATMLLSHISLISGNKGILNQQGDHFDKFSAFVRLTVDMLHHPSGRICSEQINSWTGLLRDPQIAQARILRPYLAEIVTCYMNQMVRIRWDDVENQTHPQTQLIEASFDDEEEYDAWMADLRSRSSLLYKLAGKTEPFITAQTINAKVQSVLQRHGNGEPLDNLEPNRQLSQKSEAVLQFEGLFQPLDNALGGMPSWSMEAGSTSGFSQNNNGKSRKEIAEGTQTALSELANALVSWNPSFLYLKFRRASLMEALRHFWKYNPATLLQGIDSLLRNLGLSDEWTGGSTDNKHASGEIVALQKRSGTALVSISRTAPQHLVPWLSQLSEATRQLLASEGLIPMNQMHLYEFLSCVATAVEDTQTRANFLASVLSSAIDTMESTEVQNFVSTVPSLLEGLGVMQAGSSPASITDAETVRKASSTFGKLFTALNQLLSVGRRCQEVARRKKWKNPVPATTQSVTGQLNFPDEGPVSIQDLAASDPFVPLWPRILPVLLQVYEVTMGIRRPEHQATLLSNQYQRYIYALSDDEALPNQSGANVVSGVTRKDENLLPRWSGWMNELHSTCFQMVGLLCTQRVLFAPEVAHLYPRIVSVITDSLSLQSMEHRHFTQFLKHVIACLLVSCPSTLYKTHLEPIVGPVFEHLRYRLEKTWLPFLKQSLSNGSPDLSTKALTPADCASAAALAVRGGEEWFSWYYAHSCLFVGDLDATTAEAVVEKQRVAISRTFSDIMQTAFALKGDWALVLANIAKEETAVKKNDSSRLTTGPPNRYIDEGTLVNADGTPKLENQALLDARKLLRINGLCHFLLLESESIAGNLTLTVVQCLGYPDAYTCRRTTRICHRILETVAWSPQYSHLLGQQMFTQVVKNIVTEPKWMVGLEWDMINVARDIYCRLVLGQILQCGGQGLGQEQSLAAPGYYQQAKSADHPLQGGGILTVPSDLPRQVLISLPGCTADIVQAFELQMKAKRSSKDQKDSLRELLRMAADTWSESDNNLSWGDSGGAAGGIFDRAKAEESLLHASSRPTAVPDLPEKLVSHSKLVAAANQQNDPDAPYQGLNAFKLF